MKKSKSEKTEKAKLDHIIIDGKDMILGRLCTYAAKQALLGKKVDVINCDDIIITGKRQVTIMRYKSRLHRGDVFKGPFISRSTDRLTRRTIRGMLPFKNARGKDVFSNVMCYKTTPESLKDKKPIHLKNAHVSKLSEINYITMKELSKLI